MGDETVGLAGGGGGRARVFALSLLAAATLLIATACGGSGDGAPPDPTPTPTSSPAPGGPTPVAGTPNGVSFSPAVVLLDNPSSPGAMGSPETFVVDVTAFDEEGRPIAPSGDSPIVVELHGVPAGVIVPERAEITDGTSASFHYDGSYFPNPMTITAWMARPASGERASSVAGGETGGSLGRSRVMHANPIDCSYGAATYPLPLTCAGSDPSDCLEKTVLNGLEVRAAVGYATPPQSFGTPFAVDTGSLGVVVPLGDLGTDKVGPGAAGVKFYDSSGRTYAGRYYLAPVMFALGDGSVLSTGPIKVLAIDSAYCAPGYPKCEKDPPTPTLRYLGVGFDRPATAPDDALDSPADNPFLQIVTGPDGAAISPGYVLGATSIELGITSTDGFATTALTPNSPVAGDWNAAPGCYSFPSLAEPNQFCGTVLLDVGIQEMFLDLAREQRPPGSEPAGCGEGSGPICLVPDGTPMEVLVGTPSAPSMSYGFTIEAEPSGPAPLFARWIESSKVAVNTGRRPLLAFDYLFDARCGNVGFRSVGG